MFEWLRPRNAPKPDLEAQLKAAGEVHTAAVAATAEAQASFDETGTDAAAKALLKARTTEQSTAEHLARAQRLLKEAEDREAAEARAKLEAEREELAQAAAELWARDINAIKEREQRILGELHECVEERKGVGRRIRELDHKVSILDGKLGIEWRTDYLYEQRFRLNVLRPSIAAEIERLGANWMDVHRPG